MLFACVTFSPVSSGFLISISTAIAGTPMSRIIRTSASGASLSASAPNHEPGSAPATAKSAAAQCTLPLRAYFTEAMRVPKLAENLFDPAASTGGSPAR